MKCAGRRLGGVTLDLEGSREPLRENTRRDSSKWVVARSLHASWVEMWLGINLGLTALCVFIILRVNASGPSRLCQMKVSYRVKVPLIAFRKAGSTPLKIPIGALLEWLPPDPGAPPDGHADVRWLQKDYLVNGAELYQNCERV